MKVRVIQEEWWKFRILDDDDDGFMCFEREVPEELVVRHKKAVEEFEAVQEQLRPFLEKNV